jgi:hypothetical protein
VLFSYEQRIFSFVWFWGANGWRPLPFPCIINIHLSPSGCYLASHLLSIRQLQAKSVFNVWPFKMFRKKTWIWIYLRKIKVGRLPYLALLGASPLYWELDKQQDRTYKHKPLTDSETDTSTDTQTEWLKTTDDDTNLNNRPNKQMKRRDG